MQNIFIISGKFYPNLGPLCMLHLGMGPLVERPLRKDDEVSCEVRPPRLPIRSLTSLDRA